MKLGLSVMFALLCAGTARAEPITLRFATVAPDGSSWARELRAFGRQIEAGTSGRVRVKWYWGAVAGDEVEEVERIRKGQLDGAAFGVLCERLAPTVRITRLPGVFQSLDEATAMMNVLRSEVDREAHKEGFVVLAISSLGVETAFLRAPVRNMPELRKLRLWRWDVDEVGIAFSKEMGFTILPARVWEASSRFAEGRVDGFIGVPQAALVFQWSAQVGYFMDLPYNFLWGCLALHERALTNVAPAEQAAIREAGARLQERFQELGRRTDEQLLGSVFQSAGLKRVTVSEALRSEYFKAARAARDGAAPRYVDPALLSRVLSLLADYRAEHSRKP